MPIIRIAVTACCNFQSDGIAGYRVSGGQSEHFVDEMILTPYISPAHPSNLPLAQNLDRFITLNRSSRRLERVQQRPGGQAACRTARNGFPAEVPLR
jgi:hypothetical protein